MNFRIADSFTDALTKLSGQEQKQKRTALFDVLLNPSRDREWRIRQSKMGEQGD